MRNAFLDTLYDLAVKDPRIVFITGDLGFRVVEKFMQDIPNQFLNAGVAEQNMTGIAAGMALSGKIAITYSIANFPTLRCLEQIRNDICYHDANVKIVSVGGGFAYGAMSVTHHAMEDLGVMRCIPNLTVVAPGDPVETRAATRAILAHAGPVYLRLGKAGEPTVHQALNLGLLDRYQPKSPPPRLPPARPIAASCRRLPLTPRRVLAGSSKALDGVLRMIRRLGRKRFQIARAPE